MEGGGGKYSKTERKKGQESERVTERKERRKARACCSVVLMLKCRVSTPLVEAIKRKK